MVGNDSPHSPVIRGTSSFLIKTGFLFFFSFFSFLYARMSRRFTVCSVRFVILKALPPAPSLSAHRPPCFPFPSIHQAVLDTPSPQVLLCCPPGKIEHGIGKHLSCKTVSIAASASFCPDSLHLGGPAFFAGSIFHFLSCSHLLNLQSVGCSLCSDECEG